jgi:hypothetical protein
MKRKIYKLLSGVKQGVFALALTVFSGTAYSQTTFTFNFTGNVQTLNFQPAPYFIEMWGGDGGDNLAPNTGGKGGYSAGYYNVTTPGTHYIYVAGKGITGLGSVSAPGGFNGGGTSAAYSSSGYGQGSGGGASHIASIQGLLSTLSANQADVVIVAGGGGGSGANYGGTSLQDLGGHGGGLIGGNGLSGSYGGTGGTQSVGGTGSIQNGAFGRGGDNSGSNTGGGGGGGWYGGGAAQWEGSGGGSSYIGGVTNGTTAAFGSPGYVPNPDVTGNGYVRITLLCDLGIQLTKNPICFGESINITTTATNNIVWGHTSSTATLVNVSPTSTTIYTLSGQASTGCTATQHITVTVNPLPNLTAIVTPSVLCVGETATISAQGAISYTWHPSGITGPNSTVSPPITASYNYVGENQFGCTTATVVNVIVNTNSLTVTAPASICEGSALEIVANGADTYTWSTGSFFKNTIVSPQVGSTTYTVRGTDQHNCDISEVVSINVNPRPNVTAVSDKNSVCRGESAILTASGADTYVWSNGSTTSSVNVTLPVDVIYHYTVTGTDNNGCKTSAFVSVAVSRCTGIDELTTLVGRVYPNPATEALTVELTGTSANTIEVMDVTGRVVLFLPEVTGNASVDVSSLSSGVYYVRVKSENATDIVKIVKQ